MFDKVGFRMVSDTMGSVRCLIQWGAVIGLNDWGTVRCLNEWKP